MWYFDLMTVWFFVFLILNIVRVKDNFVLELDFEPFNASFPRPSRSSSIGNGVQFLNRHLSSSMFRNKDSLEPLLDFLRAHKYKGHVSLLCLTILTGNLTIVLTDSNSSFQDFFFYFCIYYVELNHAIFSFDISFIV